MLTRRSVLAWLSALPFSGRLIPTVPQADLSAAVFQSLTVRADGTCELVDMAGGKTLFGTWAQMLDALPSIKCTEFIEIKDAGDGTNDALLMAFRGQ